MQYTFTAKHKTNNTIWNGRKDNLPCDPNSL